MRPHERHWLVESIRNAGDFPFDVEDVEERLSEVLAFYGCTEPLGEFDTVEVRRDLLALAEVRQEAEMVRLVAEAGWDP
jgi:hypothetical protein